MEISIQNGAYFNLFDIANTLANINKAFVLYFKDKERVDYVKVVRKLDDIIFEFGVTHSIIQYDHSGGITGYNSDRDKSISVLKMSEYEKSLLIPMLRQRYPFAEITF